MSHASTLTPEVQQAVENFLEYYNPARTSIHLRCLLMEALKNDLLRDEIYFLEFAHNLDGLFELLSTMAGESPLSPERRARLSPEKPRKDISEKSITFSINKTKTHKAMDDLIFSGEQAMESINRYFAEIQVHIENGGAVNFSCSRYPHKGTTEYTITVHHQPKEGDNKD